jgi:hypothetical protein
MTTPRSLSIGGKQGGSKSTKGKRINENFAGSLGQEDVLEEDLPFSNEQVIQKIHLLKPESSYMLVFLKCARSIAGSTPREQRSGTPVA